MNPLSAAVFQDARVVVHPGFCDQHRHLFPEELVKLLGKLHVAFQSKRKELLDNRHLAHQAYDQGELPQFLSGEFPDTDWTVAPIPSDLLQRRVEITGPVNSAKMVINMLSRNSDGARADCAMLDFEDSMKPSWRNVLDGIVNVIGAAEGTLTHVAAGKDGEKRYQLNPEDMAVIMVRVRGLHLDEIHCTVNDAPISAGLFDLVCCMYHSAEILLSKGKTPKFYVPKVEDRLEARWWNELFAALEESLHLECGTIRATFLIETLPAAYQIEEIIYELREHLTGLNVGRWDKIFSDIKTLKSHPDRILADRGWINMDREWMKNYALRLIRICHRRGAFALGGMASFTPGKDAETRAIQTQKVLDDKQQEAAWGHDGCWVSHPYFIGHAMKAFTKTNQRDVIPGEEYQYPDLLPKGIGPKTIEGLRTNIRVGIAYMHGWLHDIGCISWDNLMEDLATLEISRASVWQWLHHAVVLDDGTQVQREMVAWLFDDEMAKIFKELNGSADRRAWCRARDVARALFLKEEFPEFISSCPEIASMSIFEER